MKLTQTKTKTKKTQTSTAPTATTRARQSLVTATVAQTSSMPTHSANRQITADCIASCAYSLWEQAGRPQGRDVEHWLQAEFQLKQGAQSFSA